jgi:hypothetical protein
MNFDQLEVEATPFFMLVAMLESSFFLSNIEVIFESDERMISRHLVFGIAKHNQLEETLVSPVLPINMVHPIIVEVSR